MFINHGHFQFVIMAPKRVHLSITNFDREAVVLTAPFSTERRTLASLADHAYRALCASMDGFSGRVSLYEMLVKENSGCRIGDLTTAFPLIWLLPLLL